jgi:uncharacterized membrane protein
VSSRSLRHAALGDERWFGLSLIALAIFVPLVTSAPHKHEGPYLYTLAGVPGLRWLMYLGMGAAFAMAVAGLVRPSPAAVAPGSTEVRGVYHVTRHPVLMALGLYGLLHLCVAAVNASELAFFAGFPLFVLIGARHQDQRKLAAAARSSGASATRRRRAVLAARRRRGAAPAADRDRRCSVVVRWVHPAEPDDAFCRARRRRPRPAAVLDALRPSSTRLARAQ